MHLYVYLYVYYSVPLANAARALDEIRSMQKRLADERGHQGRLLRRVDEDQDGTRVTWMEIYEHVDDAFEAHLNAAFERSGVRELLAGPRHVERFKEFD